MCQFSSVAQSCLTLCNPMDCSLPGFPVHHQLPEFTQTHVHRVSDAIQPSHPLSSPSPPAPIPPSIRIFSNESVLRIRWPKYWSFSFSISPSIEYSGIIQYVSPSIKCHCIRHGATEIPAFRNSQSSGKHKTWLFSSLPLSPQSLLSFLLLFLLKHPPYPSQSKSWAFYCVTLKEDGP